MARHNALRNAIFDFCKRALLNPKLEAGAGLGHERRLTRPADILIPSWSNSDKLLKNMLTASLHNASIPDVESALYIWSHGGRCSSKAVKDPLHALAQCHWTEFPLTAKYTKQD